MKSEYCVNVKRNAEMMKTCIKFNNRVHHPGVSMHLFVIGTILLSIPIIAGKGNILRIIVCFSSGVFLIFMSLFRHNIAVARMKRSPEIELDGEISYNFGNKGVQAVKDGDVNNIGSYKNIFWIWEDEKYFYLGMNEEDLLILPKKNFEIGDTEKFRDFILEKSSAGYSWKPTNIRNICKWKINSLK